MRQITCDQILVLSCCMTLSGLLNISIPQIYHLEYGDNNSAYLVGLLLQLNELRFAKHLEHTASSVSVFIRQTNI